jgi:hypothetical protein
VTADELRAALEASRTALLAAIQGLTDRDFSAEVAEGETVITTLAALAASEREAVRVAREAVGAPPRPLPSTGGARLTRAIPPQVVHDLAGARHETMLFLENHGAPSQLSQQCRETTVGASLAAIADRERLAAQRLGERGSPS